MDRNTLTKWDKKYVWHPFTQMKEWADSKPLIIEEGDGCYLIDLDGNRYIDGVSSLWVLVHGHGKRELIDAIHKQCEMLCHSTLLGLANTPSIELARMLVNITPKNLTKVFYSDNGSTSVEIALKMAYQYWQQRGEKQRKKFICFENGYHGDTIGSVSVGGIDLFHKVYGPLLFKTCKAPSPYCYRCPVKKERASCDMACIKELENVIRQHRNEICAIIIEPSMQGAGGMITQPNGFLSTVRKISKENNILMIADEVATGFGRTGRMFACEKEHVQPDFLCVAKGITGGYLPLAATLTTDEVFSGFLGKAEESKTFFHGHTYTGNPLACAVAIENLKLFKAEKTLKNMQPKIALLKKELKRFAELPHVGEVRQEGFMVGIELVKDKKTKAMYKAAEKVGHRVIMEARRHGVIVRPLSDVIVLMPPLAIELPTLKRLLDVTYMSIRTVTESD